METSGVGKMSLLALNNHNGSLLECFVDKDAINTLIQYPASIATLAQRQPLRWANVGSPTLGQRGFVNWPNGGAPALAQRCANIGPTLAH